MQNYVLQIYYSHRIMAQRLLSLEILCKQILPKCHNMSSVGSESCVSQSVNQKAICDIATEVRDSVDKSVIRDKVSSIFANHRGNIRTLLVCWKTQNHLSQGWSTNSAVFPTTSTWYDEARMGNCSRLHVRWGSWWYLMKVLLFPFIQVTVLPLAGKRKP